LAAHRLAPAFVPTALFSMLPVVVIVLLSLLSYQYLTPWIGPFYANVASKVGIFVMLAASLNIVNGFTGQFSIGHAGFLAVGGYTAGWITYYGSLYFFDSAMVQEGLFTPGSTLFVAGCLAGGLVAAVVGYLVGLPSLRLRGDYLAIVTLGFGEILRVVLTQTGDVLVTKADVQQAGLIKTLGAVGGSLGFGGVPWYNNLFWTVLFTGLTLLVCYRLKQSSMGRAMLSVREDEIAARSMGINLTKMKVSAFVFSSALAGVAGGIFAHQSGNQLVPGELNFQLSFDILIMVVLGGLGSISGAAIAAMAVTVINEALKDPPSAVLYGAAATAVVMGLMATEHLATRGKRPLAIAALVTAAIVALAVGALAMWFDAPLRIALEQLAPRLGWVGLLVMGVVVVTLAGLLAKWRLPKSIQPLTYVRAISVSALAVITLELIRVQAHHHQVNLAEYRMIIYALALILVMILRPHGLLGLHECWDIGRLFRPAKKST